MIQVTFDDYNEHLTSINGLFQWDNGQTLEISGLNGLYVAPKIHFCTKKNDVAYVVQSTMNSGIIQCGIPDVVLQSGFNVTAYIVYEVGLDKKTIRTVTIPITPRTKPADYIDTTPENVEKVKNYLEQLRSDFDDLVDNYETFKSDEYGVFKNLVNGYDIPNIRRDLDDAINDISDLSVGISSSTTTFNADGSITKVGAEGTTTTVFNADGSITETNVKNGVTTVKKITFSDTVINEVVLQ